MDQLDGVVLMLSERWQENDHLNIQSRFCNGGQKSRPDAKITIRKRIYIYREYILYIIYVY